MRFNANVGSTLSCYLGKVQISCVGTAHRCLCIHNRRSHCSSLGRQNSMSVFFFSRPGIPLYRKITNWATFKLPGKRTECVFQETQRYIKTTRVGRRNLKGLVLYFLFFLFVYKKSRVGTPSWNQGRSGNKHPPGPHSDIRVEIRVYRGVHFFLTFALNHRSVGLHVRTASNQAVLTCTHDLCFQQK